MSMLDFILVEKNSIELIRIFGPHAKLQKTEEEGETGETEIGLKKLN